LRDTGGHDNINLTIRSRKWWMRIQSPGNFPSSVNLSDGNC
jgi:hypothetical protein